MRLLAASVTFSAMRLSLYGGVRSITWWATAVSGAAVLVLDIAGELKLGIADRSTFVYLSWIAVRTATPSSGR